MAETLPAFVIGVGQAGIAAMNAVHDIVAENNDQDAFGFYALDTDGAMLNTAPDGSTRKELKAGRKFETEDKGRYPYLTPEMELTGKGALRQRPVGRYKLDSRGVEDFSAVFQDLARSIEAHANDVDYSFDREDDSYNIFLIHSLGGGTGSGTFPLLAASVGRITEELERMLGTDIYAAGMGVVPLVQFTESAIDPPGDPIYYPNSYASLNDLSKLLNVDDTGPLSIPIYSKSFGAGGQATHIEERTQAAFEANDLPVDATPFDNYWLVGVDEAQIMGEYPSSRHETYREQINRTMAESIYSLCRLEISVENWATGVKGLPKLGTISHSEVRVPHEAVKEYCELQAELETKRALVEEDPAESDQSIYEEITDLEEIQERLTEIKRRPERAIELREDGTDLRNDLRGLLEAELGGGEQLVGTNSGEDVEAVFDRIEQDYDTASLLLATHLFKDLLDDPSAAPRIENHWSELVADQWSTYEMVERTKYGGQSISTLEGKAEQLSNFYSDKLDEYESELEDIDDRMDTWENVKDSIPASLGFLQSHKQRVEASMQRVRDARDDLLEAQGRYERVQGMRDARTTYRRRAREQLDEQISSIDSRITEKQETIDETQKAIDRLERSIESAEADLTREKTAKRIGVLPIEEDMVSELDADRLEELDSFHTYVEQGFVSTDRVSTGLSNWLDKSYAWNEPVFTMDSAFTETPGNQRTRNELWVLCAEENKQYPKEYINDIEGDQRWAGESNLGYIEDPYTITFVSYYNDNPIEDLDLYQKLDRMATDGTLDSMAGTFEDHRLSFAYPEWYDRDIQKAFTIKTEVTVPEPPELDVDNVRKPDLDEGAKRNYIKTSGLDSYVWQGAMWEEYEMPAETTFTGWEQELAQLTWRALQQATPDADLKSEWMAGQADWADILDAYRENILDREGIQLTFESPER